MTQQIHIAGRVIPGVKFVAGPRERGNGKLYSYAYHRKTGRRIRADAGTPEFFAEIEHLNSIAGPGKWGRDKSQRRSMDGIGWVYFIEAHRPALVKIGWSKNPKARLTDMVNYSPVGMKLLTGFCGTVAQEKILHSKFAALRAHGEWFRKESALSIYINEVFKTTGRAPWSKKRTSDGKKYGYLVEK